jgi:glycosyltransferase involved in cell wall biosynthesis
MGLNPKVTIGLCAKDAENSLAWAIESVIHQDFPHESMEIVFVDDGSVDNTLKIMKFYASKMDIPARIFSGEWRGLGKARNTVINNAQGGYIIWLDSDEALEKSFVRKQVALMDAYPEAGIATAKYRLLPKMGLVLMLELVPHVVEYSRQDWKTPTKLPGTGAATYRVSAAKQIHGFDESLEGNGEDIEFASRIKQKGWQIIRGEAVFYETHGRLSTWGNLWKRYAIQGLNCRSLYRKNNKLFSLYRMNPIASFIAALYYSILGYQTTKRLTVILLPFHFSFKMTAWLYGFTVGYQKIPMK